jgi:hypothetical protein
MSRINLKPIQCVTSGRIPMTWGMRHGKRISAYIRWFYLFLVEGMPQIMNCGRSPAAAGGKTAGCELPTGIQIDRVCGTLALPCHNDEAHTCSTDFDSSFSFRCKSSFAPKFCPEHGPCECPITCRIFIRLIRATPHGTADRARLINRILL